MQALPLSQKLEMTKKRIESWYEAWKRYEIYNTKTKKTRYVTWYEEPNENGCFVEKKTGQVLVKKTKLKPTEMINGWVDGQVYVSFSGGKDSTVLKHIVDGMYSDVPSVFVNTGLEYPEIRKFALSKQNVTELRPEMRFDEVLKTYGYPIVSKEVAQTVYEGKKNKATGKYAYRIKKLKGELKKKDGTLSTYNIPKWRFLLDSDFKISHKCCDVMKKNPSKKYEKETGRQAILGTMAEESLLRKQKWTQYGCNAFEKDRPTSQPLSFWTEQDVLWYIKLNQLEIASVYGEIVFEFENELDGQTALVDYADMDFWNMPADERPKLKTTGCDRTGCVFCGFGCHLEKEPNRFQKLKETHPRQYEYCIGGGEYVDGQWQPNKEGLGMAKVLDFIGVKY